MALYKAKQKLYVNDRLILIGETFESNDTPGIQWEPLDKPVREEIIEAPVAPEARAEELPPRRVANHFRRN